MEERVPPFSEEAERASVGAVLVEAERLGPVALEMGLTPEAWYVPQNRVVMGAVFAMLAEGRCVDALTVAEYLRVQGGLEAAGGGAYLDRCVDACVTAVHGGSYLQTVLGLWTARRLIEECRRAEDEVRRAQDPIVYAAGVPERLQAVVVERKEEESNLEVMRGSMAEWRRAKAGGEKAFGLPTPWRDLTELLCGFGVGLHLVAGRPSEGKTTLAAQMASGWVRAGVGTACASLDIGRRRWLERMVAFEAKVSLPKLKGGWAREDQLAEAEKAIEELAGLSLWVTERHAELRMLTAWVRTLRVRRKIGVVVVDHSGQVVVSDLGKLTGNPYVTMSEVSASLKRLALELGIPVVLLCQLSRDNEKDGRPPRLSDLRDSGKLEQDAATVTFVYRDMKRVKEMEKEAPGSTVKQRPTWVDVAKNQDGETGRLRFWFLPSYFDFTPTEDFDKPPLDQHQEGGVAAGVMGAVGQSRQQGAAAGTGPGGGGEEEAGGEEQEELGLE